MAAQAGDKDPVVYVLLPRREPEAIKGALASHAAAQETVQSRPTPQTQEGKDAQRAMKGRLVTEDDRLRERIRKIVADARVYQGGGTAATAQSFRAAVELAAQRSFARLFPKFDVADNADWGKVVAQARGGAPDALAQIGYAGDAPLHPVCKAVLADVSGGGTKGKAIYGRFSNPPFGWPKDAINGAIMALLTSGHVRAARDAVNLDGPEDLQPSQIGKTTFYKEDEPPSTDQRLAVRGLLAAAGLRYEPGREQAQVPSLLQALTDRASAAGGEPPLPEVPDTSHIEILRALAGNQQFRCVADAHKRLKADLATWEDAIRRRDERQPEWQSLDALLRHALSLDVAAQVRTHQQAIEGGRRLLDDPDPVRPLLDAIAGPLRDSVKAAAGRLGVAHAEAMAKLEASEEWSRLTEADRKEIINLPGLRPPPQLDLSTRKKLLAILTATPLDAWEDRIEVMGARATRAWDEAARRLEPTAIRVSLDPATLKTQDDAEAYLEHLRERIMGPIINGRTVII